MKAFIRADTLLMAIVAYDFLALFDHSHHSTDHLANNWKFLKQENLKKSFIHILIFYIATAEGPIDSINFSPWNGSW